MKTASLHAHLLALAHRQAELDRAQTTRFPALFERKRTRMAQSAHAFLRGSSPLFHEVLAAEPELGDGPPEEGWIVGDMHLENVGVFRGEERTLRFDLNDFDDATWAPRRFDVLRLATSTALAAQAASAPSDRVVAILRGVLSAYVTVRSGHGASHPVLPAQIRAMLERAERRSKRELLDARAPLVGAERRFVRGERYLTLPSEVERQSETLLSRFIHALGPRAPNRATSWRIVDVAQRVAGTGSLGRLRLAMLVRDDLGDDRILDFKEAAPPGPARAWTPAPLVPPGEAHRMVAAAHALIRMPPRLMAAVAYPEQGLELFVRQLAPVEDKLEVARLDARALEDVAAATARVLAASHGPWPSAPWSRDEQGALVERALALAALFVGIHLAAALG